MLNIFSFSSFEDLMDEIKKNFVQADLSRKMDIPFQTIHSIFKDNLHLVMSNVKKWTTALNLSRIESLYFELLCIIYSYPKNKSDKQEKLLARAYRIAVQLEHYVNPVGNAADSLIFMLDPLIGIIREFTELNAFPNDEEDIYNWVTDNIAYVGALECSSVEKKIRIKIAWRWLKELNAVLFSEKRNRWVKTTPNIQNIKRTGRINEDIKGTISNIVHINNHKEFLHEAATSDFLFSKPIMFSFPMKSLPLLNELCNDFIYEKMMKKFTYLVNMEDRERLKEEDADYYNEVVAYEKELIERGFEIPKLTDEEMDNCCHMILSARKLAK